MQITVTKRDGTRAPFNADRINKSIERACQGIEDWVGKVVQIASETRLMLYDGITTEELDHATINAALQNVQEDPAYDLIATRLLLKTIYKRVLGEYEDSKSMLAQKHAESFIPYISENVAGGLLDARMATNFNLEAIASALTISRDELFGYAGLSTTMDRYTLKNKEQKSLETPQYFFMRVAMGLSYNEPDPTAAAIRFYNRMSRLEYIAGGTTNIGAGTTRSALSNCFLMQIEDDMEHIAKSVADVMMLSKAAGGIGASVTKLRASGSPLSSNNTTSSGPTPFAKIIDTAIRAVQRGGKKKGALCFYMENWHLDFPDFLMWRHNAGDDYLRMRTADTAVFISDEFMRRVKSGEDWYMFDPHETPDLIELYGQAFAKRYAEYVAMAEAGQMRTFKKALAEDQYRAILVMLESTSHPWITFKDPINLRALNNNTGTIHMSNLCTEICLPQDRENIAVCNLASLNIARHIKDVVMDNQTIKEIDWEKLGESVRIAIRHLDNLIDINVLPIPEAAHSDKMNRAVGMGVMGFAEVVEIMRMAYDSQEAYELTDKLFEFISYNAIDESANLAQERGSYPNFAGSEWSKGLVPFDTMARLEASRGMELTVDKTSHAAELGINWDVLREKVKGGMRNATLMAVAPNANIGLVAGTTPGIDPRFAQMFSRNKISGKYLDLNHNLVAELKELGIWEQVRGELIEVQGDLSVMDSVPEDLKARYKSAFTTDPLAFIEVAARAQKWTDQALSRNMYLETRVIGDLMDIYSTAWEKGLKTTYYLHMKPRHTAEQSTTTVNKSTAIGKSGFGSIRDAAAKELRASESVVSPLSPIAPAPAFEAPTVIATPQPQATGFAAAPAMPVAPLFAPAPVATESVQAAPVQVAAQVAAPAPAVVAAEVVFAPTPAVPVAAAPVQSAGFGSVAAPSTGFASVVAAPVQSAQIAQPYQVPSVQPVAMAMPSPVQAASVPSMQTAAPAPAQSIKTMQSETPKQATTNNAIKACPIDPAELAQCDSCQ
jgi:ribonucleoside-diphosphate reductase alpha chain